MECEPSTDRGWQVGKSLADRMCHMLTNQVDCDVTFVFPHTKPATKISAHKLVLKAGSPVFEAMFSGNFVETHKDVNIVDIVSTVFHEMLRYFYTDDANITANNVLPLMSAAKKYMVDGLAAMCTSFLTNKLDENNVCKILNDSLMYRVESLAQNCCEFIGTKAETVIKTAGFTDLSQGALGTLLEYDDLVVKNEMLLYDACLMWARKQQAKGSPSDLDLRDTLGHCIHQIRFHSMKCDDFAKKIGTSSAILTAEEKSHIYSYLITKSTEAKDQLNKMGFNMGARQQPVIKYPFDQSMSPVQFGLQGINSETITLLYISGPRVQLRGFSVYGGKKSGEKHDISIDLSETPAHSMVYQQPPANYLERISKTLVSSGSNKPIEVELSQRHELTPNKKYNITLRSNGPSTFYKQFFTSREQSVHEGLSLMFDDGYCNNHMTTRMAEFLFSTC